MADTQMITMLKVDLGISTTVYDERLGQYLDSAKAEITREGYAFPETLTVDDMQLIVMYAAWMWRRRDNMDAMPRMLRWAINNRLFQQHIDQTIPSTAILNGETTGDSSTGGGS